jgi:hypothetical protein
MTAEQAQSFEDAAGFPPESDEDEVEIEVLDDTPEADRVEPRAAAERIDLDSEEFEQEVENYSDSAQKRIKTLKYEYHEERRAKEAAIKQNSEAVSYAEQVSADNASLRETLDQSNSILIEQYGARTDAELEQARKDYKDAYDGGETDDLLAAQEKITKLQLDRDKALDNADRFQRQRAAPVQTPVAQPQQPQGNGTPDVRAMEWLRDNDWFHKTGNEDMTGYAVGLHQKLVMEGLNPQIHEDYYKRIDQGMRTVFPEYEFSGEQEGGSGEVNVTTHAVTAGNRPPPVGGPSRGGKPPRKVQLTTTQVSLAKRLGLTNKQYAAQVAKELTNG